MGVPGKRRTGSSKSKKTFKQGLRKTFRSRHIDQVWEDVRKEQEALVSFDSANKDKLGPVGTTSKAVLDEDTPGGGAFYCTPCSRYFVSERALGEHSRTKPHKRRLKELHGAQPHRQKDAEGAAGMGAADNGQQQQRRKEQQAPAAAAMEMPQQHSKQPEVCRSEQSDLLMAERQQSHEAASSSSRGTHATQESSGRYSTIQGLKTKAPHSSTHARKASAQRQPHQGAQLAGGTSQRRQQQGQQSTYTSAQITSFLAELAAGLAGGRAEAALARACKAAAKAGLGAEAVALLRQLQPDLALTKPWTAAAIVEVLAPRSAAQALQAIPLLPPNCGAPYEAVLHAILAEDPPRSEGLLDRVFTAMRRETRLPPHAWRPHAWTLLMRAHQKLGRPGSAVEVFEEAQRRGIWTETDTVSANMALDGLSGSAQAAFAKFEELVAAGLAPTLVTFNTLLKACMRCHDLPRAQLVMGWISAAGLQADARTYASFVKVASYANDLEAALATLPAMDAAGVEPSPAVWGAVLVACGKAGQMETALGMWARLRSTGAAPSTDTLNALLTACVGCGQGERALSLLREAQALGVQPDVVTYNVAIKACQSGAGASLSPGMLEQGFALAAEMRAAGLEPDVITHTSLARLCAQAADGQRALALHQGVKAAGLRVDKTYLTAVMSALGAGGLAQEALEVFHSMVWGPRRCKPNAWAFRTIARICREAGLLREALNAYSGMRRVGLKPSNAEWRELIAAAADAALAEPRGGGLVQQVAEFLGLAEGASRVDLHGLSVGEARAAVLCCLASVQQRAAAGQAALASALVFITGKGRHSDPETGPLLHAAVMRLLNDELKLPTLSPQQLPAAGSLQRARSPHALPPAGRYAGAAAGAHGALDSAGADMLCLDGGPAASGGEVSAAGLKTTPGTVVVGRAALAAWVASKQGDAAAAEQLGADLQ